MKRLQKPAEFGKEGIGRLLGFTAPQFGQDLGESAALGFPHTHDVDHLSFFARCRDVLNPHNFTRKRECAVPEDVYRGFYTELLQIRLPRIQCAYFLHKQYASCTHDLSLVVQHEAEDNRSMNMKLIPI